MNKLIDKILASELLSTLIILITIIIMGLCLFGTCENDKLDPSTPRMQTPFEMPGKIE